jgi:hypothetical protein
MTWKVVIGVGGVPPWVTKAALSISAETNGELELFHEAIPAMNQRISFGPNWKLHASANELAHLRSLSTSLRGTSGRAKVTRPGR